MRWIEQAPGLPLHDVAAARGRDPGVDAAIEAADSARALAVAITAAAADLALRHVTGHSVERGGLLLGEVFAHADDVHLARLVVVTQAVPALSSEGTGVSLRMGTDVWQRGNAQLRRGERVVGWYHSHPGLGAFFSHTDRRTQQAFFPHAYSVGWVIDPERGESALFVGPDSAEPAATAYWVGDWVSSPAGGCR